MTIIVCTLFAKIIIVDADKAGVSKILIYLEGKILDMGSLNCKNIEG